jgi:septal ring factor EnvC (AmiA/AmiB activator)
MKIDSPVPARRSSTWPLATFLAFGVAAAALATAQEGVKQTEAVIKKSEDAVKAITDGRQQLEKTLATYNSIIEGSATDWKAAYKDLNNEVKNCESKVTDITKRRDAMNAEADKLYKSWDESIATIATPDLKKRSETRLAQTRERLGQVGEAGQVDRNE